MVEPTIAVGQEV